MFKNGDFCRRHLWQMFIASVRWRRSTSNIISYSPEEQTFSHSGYLMKMINDSTLVGWSTEEAGSFHCDLLAQEFEPGIKEVLSKAVQIQTPRPPSLLSSPHGWCCRWSQCAGSQLGPLLLFRWSRCPGRAELLEGGSWVTTCKKKVLGVVYSLLWDRATLYD